MSHYDQSKERLVSLHSVRLVNDDERQQRIRQKGAGMHQRKLRALTVKPELGRRASDGPSCLYRLGMVV